MSDADYEVGYGRPPVHTRFQKGQSGNPAGRKPGNPTVGRRIPKSVFETMMKVTIDGKVVRKPRIHLAHMQMFNTGMRGDMRALKAFSDAFDKERRSKALTETYDEPQQFAPIMFVPVEAKPALDGDYKILTSPRGSTRKD